MGIPVGIEQAKVVLCHAALDISGAPPKRAQLAFIGAEKKDNTADLEFEINGKVVLLPSPRFSFPDAKQYVQDLGSRSGGWTWTRWHYQDIPGEYLKHGKNHLLIRSRDGRPGWSIMVADYADFHKGCTAPPTFPKSSAKSEDGGKTWRQDNLGSQGKLSGEYVLRILLASYRPTGALLSPVIDAAGENGTTFKTARILRTLRVAVESRTTSRTGLSLEVRSGESPVYAAEHWGDWVRPASDGNIAAIRGRYVQWRIDLSTNDPEESPEIMSLALDAEATQNRASAGKVSIVREDNFELGQAPEGYSYEDYRSEYLQDFRKHFKLDEVVARAHTDWERQQRLLDWAYFVSLKKERSIFPWDPRSWVDDRRMPDGSLAMNKYSQRARDEMCLYPDVTLMAALQSFGYPARHINMNSEGISGHEITEVWSNEFGKWIYLDATRDFYWYDKETGIPISTLEIHRALAERLAQVETWRHPFIFVQRPETYLKDLPIAAAGRHQPYSVEGEANFVFSTSAHLRMIPRSDIFSHPSPGPVSQGREVWCWDGYLNWADSKVPPLEHFTHHTNREKDFNWSLNQIRYVAEETPTPGLLTVSLNHNMPYLSVLLARIDGEEWRKVEARFQWSLHAGQNSLEVRGRNTGGVEGMTSSLVLEYQP